MTKCTVYKTLYNVDIQMTIKYNFKNMDVCWLRVKKYKTFSMLMYSCMNMSENWKNEKLCGSLGFSNFHDC